MAAFSVYRDRTDSMNYTYIVECADGTLYTGWTPDLKRRLLRHNDGRGAKYTRSRRPVKLVYYEISDTKQAAMQREYAIKKMTRAQKLQMIAGFDAADINIECNRTLEGPSYRLNRHKKILTKMGDDDMKKVITIAGSDSSGGAGIQADIKTMMAHGVFAMSAITALTAQNTTGVYGIMEATPEFVAAQIDCVFGDIRPDAVKIGMVSSAAIIEKIAERLIVHKAENVVVDPVMVSTSGSNLLDPSAQETLVNKLLPLADLITPNIPEAEKLCGFEIKNEEDMIRAAEVIAGMLQGSVLIKGGHEVETANDLLYDHGEITWFFGERIDNPNTHGTGCTLSSAIASNLALGHDMKESVALAKAYITGALADGLDLGSGSGPLNHAYRFAPSKKDA